MRQLQLFTTAELAKMRDRTKSRSYSPAGDEFRRIHERQRAWGLKRRHAERLRHVQAARAAAASTGQEHGQDRVAQPASETMAPHPGNASRKSETAPIPGSSSDQPTVSARATCQVRDRPESGPAGPRRTGQAPDEPAQEPTDREPAGTPGQRPCRLVGPGRPGRPAQNQLALPRPEPAESSDQPGLRTGRPSPLRLPSPRAGRSPGSADRASPPAASRARSQPTRGQPSPAPAHLRPAEPGTSPPGASRARDQPSPGSARLLDRPSRDAGRNAPNGTANNPSAARDCPLPVAGAAPCRSGTSEKHLPVPTRQHARQPVRAMRARGAGQRALLARRHRGDSATPFSETPRITISRSIRGPTEPVRTRIRPRRETTNTTIPRGARRNDEHFPLRDTLASDNESVNPIQECRAA